jgi:hypothetical protein
MSLHHFPTLSIIQFHPIIFAILNLASALESLSEQLSEVVIVWCILESQVTHIAKVLIELLCSQLEHHNYDFSH